MLQFVQLEVSATLKQIKVYAVNMWVTIVIEIIQVGLCCNHAGGINMHMAISIVIMQVAISVVAMYVTASLQVAALYSFL